MTLLTVGFNHQTAPIALREKIAFPTGEAVRNALAELRARLPGEAAEAALLSTCNRTEVYVRTEVPEAAQPALLAWFGSLHGVPGTQVDGHLYALPGEAAVAHAFRVACGLDSMVLGEPQILGQMKEAARIAQSSRTLGSHLHQLFQRSFSVAKEVRTQTSIGAQSVSMAAASVRLGQRIFEDVSQSSVLLVGAGEMIELCAAHWARHAGRIAIANRTVERAEALAARHGAEAIALGRLPERIAEFDIVLSCTASTRPIIGLEMVESALRRRRRRPMLMIDLAVPRDIETAIGRLDDVYLYTVDDLRDVVDAGMQERRAAVAQAERIITQQVHAFMEWQQQRRMVPLIRELHQRGDALRQMELERALRALQKGDDPAAVLEAFSVALTNKFLHGSTALLNGPGASNPEVIDVVRQFLPGTRR